MTLESDTGTGNHDQEVDAMPRPVVGLDGTAEIRAAAVEAPPTPPGHRGHRGGTARAGHRNRRPDAVPMQRAEAAEPLVLDTRATSGVEGFPAGRLAHAALAYADGPVAPVHAARQAPDEHEPDPRGPAGAAAARSRRPGPGSTAADRSPSMSATEAARVRATSLCVVRSRHRPLVHAHRRSADHDPYAGPGGSRPDPTVGRGVRRTFPGTRTRPATRLHHTACPVAVVTPGA